MISTGTGSTGGVGVSDEGVGVASEDDEGVAVGSLEDAGVSDDEGVDEGVSGFCVSAQPTKRLRQRAIIRRKLPVFPKNFIMIILSDGLAPLQRKKIKEWNHFYYHTSYM